LNFLVCSKVIILLPGGPAMREDDVDLYKGLQTLSQLSFPKQCATCGRRYETAEEFISRTETLRRSSGLKEDMDDNNQVIVELFRNCPCGSTLMDEFNNRRNLSKSGILRRKKFDELLHRLVRSGIEENRCRRELLNIMNGRGSKLLKVPPSKEI